MSDAIEILNLSRYYGAVKAVDGISLTIPRGEIFGLLGPNGAGKSTTVKMLTTLLPPTSGTALVLGCDIVKDPSGIREKIGYVPQLLSADGDLTGYENLLISAKYYGLDSGRRKARIREVLAFMGLTEFADQLASTYSGGMIRRLEIGAALLHEPEVLFLDEPTVGLDPSARKSLWENIEELQSRYGTTILLTTHDMDEADRLCDRVAFMYQGRIVCIGAPEKLKADIGGKPGTLGDVFIYYTGTSVKQGDDLDHVRQVRRTISRLD